MELRAALNRRLNVLQGHFDTGERLQCFLVGKR
jgi:hypothetical protein